MKDNLEIYVHIPFCVRKCKYCDFLSFPAGDKEQRQYVQALLQEIRYYGPMMRDRRVSTIYFGGGTPSWLDAKLLILILEEIKKQFTVNADAEISMECNPGTITEDNMRGYHLAGINRLSIGLQSTDDEELKLLGRIHTYQQFLKTYELARNAGFTNINVDLMSGLPYQTTERYMKSLSRVIRLKPEHISAYSLIIEKGTPFYDTYKFDVVKQQAGMETEMLPNEDDVYRICQLTREMLEAAGYERYEISNYARKGHVCRHNVGYWERENYLGLGLGAASLLDEVRYQNVTDFYTYIENAEHISTKELSNVLGTSLHESGELLSKQAAMEEFMFLGPRKISGISRVEFERCFGVSLESVYREPLEELKEEGLITVGQGRVALTREGLDVSNYAMAKFLLE